MTYKCQNPEWARKYLAHTWNILGHKQKHVCIENTVKLICIFCKSQSSQGSICISVCSIFWKSPPGNSPLCTSVLAIIASHWPLSVLYTHTSNVNMTLIRSSFLPSPASGNASPSFGQTFPSSEQQGWLVPEERALGNAVSPASSCSSWQASHKGLE